MTYVVLVSTYFKSILNVHKRVGNQISGKSFLCEQILGAMSWSEQSVKSDRILNPGPPATTTSV